MENKIVIALGGNALQSKNSAPTAEAQLEIIKSTCKYIAEISDRGYEIAIVHGNGPQVGRIVLAYEAAKDVVPVMPFDVCGAMSQGYIGYHLQQSLKDTLNNRKEDVSVVTIITQIEVGEKDIAFENPTKPIGPFFTELEARSIAKEKGFDMKEDAGRGWRRVVASPYPQKIVEINAIKKLWKDAIIITCGGGGIPVVRDSDGTLRGVDAVIDKDFAAELLAENIGADVLLILTEVEKIAINFNKPDQKGLDHITIKDAERYITEGHFAPGSMLPKVEAAIRFVDENPNRKAIITSLDKAVEALDGKAGTIITYS